MAWRRSARRWRPHMGWIQRTWRASAMSSRATGARHRMSVAFTARRGKYAATAGWLRAVCVHHSQLCGHLVILFWYCSPTMLPTECSRAAQRARGNHRQATRLSAVQAFGNGYLLAAPVKPPPAGAARRAPHAQGHARRDLLSAGSARHRPEDPQCQARCQAAGRRAQLQPRRLGRFRRPQVRAPGQAGWLSWFGMWQWRASECPMCSGHLDSACTSSAFAACHQAGQVAHCMCCPLRPQRRRARRRDEPWRRSGHAQPHARRRQAAQRTPASAAFASRSQARCPAAVNITLPQARRPAAVTLLRPAVALRTPAVAPSPAMRGKWCPATNRTPVSMKVCGLLLVLQATPCRGRALFAEASTAAAALASAAS